MKDPTSGRVPEQGPDWFLVATEACGDGTPDWFLVAIEACGGRTPDLGLFLGVSVFIGISGIGLTSGGSPSHPRDRGPRPGG